MSNSPGLASIAPYFAGTLAAIYIAFRSAVPWHQYEPESHLRFGSDRPHLDSGADLFYCLVLAMLFAVLVYRRTGRAVYCAKLYHHNGARCVFTCTFGEMKSRRH